MRTSLKVKGWVETPRGWSLLGAIVGAGVGALLMRRAFTVRRAVENQELILALRGFALGIFSTLLLPVHAHERRLIGPSGPEVRAGLSSSSMGSLRSEELMGAERPSLEGSDRAESLAFPTGSRIPPLPPLDDVSTKSH